MKTNKRPDIVFSTANPCLYHATFGENITFFDRDSNVDCENVLKKMEMEHTSKDLLLTGKQGLLSDGQRKRVHLARAIISNSPIMLLDEPFANMEKELAQKISNCITSDPSRCVIITCQEESDLTRNFNRIYHISLRNDYDKGAQSEF